MLRLIGALIASLAFCQAIVFGPLVLFALHGLGLSDAGYGLLLGVAAVGNVLGGTVAGRLDHQFGARVLLPAGGVLAAAAYVVCGLATSLARRRRRPRRRSRGRRRRQRGQPDAAPAPHPERAPRPGRQRVALLHLRRDARSAPSLGGFLVQWFGVRAPVRRRRRAAARGGGRPSLRRSCDELRRRCAAGVA